MCAYMNQTPKTRTIVTRLCQAQSWHTVCLINSESSIEISSKNVQSFFHPPFQFFKKRSFRFFHVIFYNFENSRSDITNFFLSFAQRKFASPIRSCWRDTSSRSRGEIFILTPIFAGRGDIVAIVWASLRHERPGQLFHSYRQPHAAEYAAVTVRTRLHRWPVPSHLHPLRPSLSLLRAFLRQP